AAVVVWRCRGLSSPTAAPILVIGSGGADHPTVGLLLVGEDVFEEQACPRRYLLVGEDLGAQREHLSYRRQTPVLDQEADVLRVRVASGQHLHGQQVLGRGRRHTQARVVEDPWSSRVAARAT